MKRILVVDDSSLSRELLVEALSGPKYELKTAADGDQAVAAAEAFDPDLVLMDIQMPGLDGYGALQALRSHPRFLNLPVVAVTAHVLKAERDRALGAGFNGFLPKPIDLSMLRTYVAQMLNRP
ncbi:response regulator [Bryobacter aggregatus]|uniref:response regulator n=1 Tax=Bryobacter aggregatus TaxID=360054 RepID=UPI0004E2840C|nr:response regulator [Bryobacter aggregatus]